MPHGTPLITLMSVGLGLAFVFGMIATRLRLSPLVGYLIAGVVIGPFTPGYIADAHLASELAEMGVILLMFGVGLHFSLDDLMSVRRIALPGAVVQIAVATLLGLGMGMMMGWTVEAGIVFGLALSVASTVVLLRALQERHVMHTKKGKIAVGWLIVEDLAMVLALVLLPTWADLRGQMAASGGGFTWDQAMQIGWAVLLTFGKVGAFAVIMLVVGKRIDSVAAASRGASRFARTVPSGRAGDCAGRSAGRVRTVRRVVCARRVLRRHDHGRERTVASGRERDAAAARRVRRAVLCLGRHAVRSDDGDVRTPAAAGRGR